MAETLRAQVVVLESEMKELRANNKKIAEERDKLERKGRGAKA